LILTGEKENPNPIVITRNVLEGIRHISDPNIEHGPNGREI
jgi:hypothetical protein